MKGRGVKKGRGMNVENYMRIKRMKEGMGEQDRG